MTPRTLREAARQADMRAIYHIPTATRPCTWSEDNRRVAWALVGAVICIIGILLVLFFVE